MQVKLSGPIQAISGSLDKNSGAYFTTRNGKTFLCFRRQSSTRDAAKPAKPAVQPDKTQLQRQRFVRMQTITNEIMHCPTLRALYETLFRRQHKYPTLRGFVCHQVSDQLKQANL